MMVGRLSFCEFLEAMLNFRNVMISHEKEPGI